MANGGRTKGDDALILPLACGATVESAAHQAGVSERTAFRRLKDPKFQERLAAATRDIAKRATNGITAASLEAVKTLVRLLREDMPPSVQLGAARAIIDLGTKLREQAELSERVAALERQVPGAM